MKPQKRPRKREYLLETISLCIDEGRYRETFHALMRKTQRDIILPTILFVLRNGYHEKKHDHFDERFWAWNYSIRGETPDRRQMRIIVSFEEMEMMLIITAFYLDK